MVLRALGSGGFGRAFKAIPIERDSCRPPVLVKSLQYPENASIIRAACEVRREIKEAVGPEVLTDFLVDELQEPGQYFVYTYVKGEDLGTYLTENPASSREDMQNIRRIIEAVYEDIFALIENGVVHRDVCAGNIVCGVNDNGGLNVTLIDPDLLARSDTNSTQTTGRPLYWPPEMFNTMNRKFSASGDLFSAGVLTARILGRTGLAALGFEHVDCKNHGAIFDARCDTNGFYFSGDITPESFVATYRNYPFVIRDIIYGLLQAAAASMQNAHADRPKSMAEVRKLLYSKPPNLAWTVSSLALRLA